MEPAIEVNISVTPIEYEPHRYSSGTIARVQLEYWECLGHSIDGKMCYMGQIIRGGMRRGKPSRCKNVFIERGQVERGVFSAAIYQVPE